MAKVEEIQARSVDRVIDSKAKAETYVKEQQMNEVLPNLSSFDHPIEEYEIE